MRNANRLSISTYLLGAKIKKRFGYDYDALIFLNKILTDDKTTVSTAYAYMSRAKIFYSNKLYRNAYNNLMMAEANGMSSCSVEKQNCENNFQHETVNFDKNDLCLLSQTTENQKPWIENGLKICRDSKMKPYIITDRQLSVGDVVCFEKGLFTFSNGRDHPSDLIDVDLAHTRCYNCLTHNNLDLVPCFGCDSGEFT